MTDHSERTRKKLILTGLLIVVLLLAIAAVILFWYRGLSTEETVGILSTETQSGNPAVSMPSSGNGPASGLKPVSSGAERASSQMPSSAGQPSGNSSGTFSQPGNSYGVRQIRIAFPSGDDNLRGKSITLTQAQIEQFMKLYKNVKMEYLWDKTQTNPGDGSVSYHAYIDYGGRTDILRFPEFQLNNKIYKASTGAKELIGYVESLDPAINFHASYYIIGREDGVTGVTIYAGGQKYQLPEGQVDGLLKQIAAAGFTPTGEEPSVSVPVNAKISVSCLYGPRVYELSNRWIVRDQSGYPSGGPDAPGDRVCTAAGGDALFDYLENSYPSLFKDVPHPE